MRARLNRSRFVPVRAVSLAGIIRENDLKIGAELGVFRGDTFRYLLTKFRDLHLTGVDLWERQPEKNAEYRRGGRSYDDRNMEACLQRVCKIAKRFPTRAKLIRMDTVEAARWVPDASLDFVFIDACHLYESVKADIEAWLPKIRAGGWITGHDWEVGSFPGVVAAVRELLGEPHVYEGHVWGMQVEGAS